MKNTIIYQQIALLMAFISLFLIPRVQADAVTEWNQQAGDTVINGNVGPLLAERILAIVQTAVYEAINAITQRYRVSDLKLTADPKASVGAAVAAMNHAILSRFVLSQQAVIENAYEAALEAIAGGDQKQRVLLLVRKWRRRF